MVASLDTIPTIHKKAATTMQIETIAKIAFIRLERIARITDSMALF